ncbi:MAG: 23S rRNA (guanosine(2251)-2'-O)-methyltransferase RlmB [Acidobacteria bacterium]|nr:23S rRNA (guanosine(2251)-2'-O)-methyltransferase RlmB [Acidobacteriota bacterium]
MVAIAAAHRYRELDELPADAPLLVLLDGVEDPHNLGAVIRTAHAAGASAVLIPERRAVGLTETVVKAAAGAVEYLAVVRIGNVSQTIEKLKQAGYWVYGLDERGTENYDQVAFTRPTLLVLGGEGHGLHEQVRKHCDVLVRIPMSGAVSSLNVSVAAGVVLFEWKRRQG